MKKRLTALFIFAIALISVFSLASCGPKEDSGNKDPEPSSGIEKVEVVTTGDYGTRGLYLKSDKVEGYDYTPCFSIKVDGNDVEVKSEYIDASAVQAANGTYGVTCTYKNASATLNVNVYEKASVYLISSQYEVNGISLPRDLAEEHDYTKYFMINAGGASVEVKPEYIDSSAVKNVIGTYTVTCTYEGATAELVVHVNKSTLEEKIIITTPLGPVETCTDELWDDFKTRIKSRFTIIDKRNSPDGTRVTVTDDMVDYSEVKKEEGSYTVYCAYEGVWATLTVKITEVKYDITLKRDSVTLNVSRVGKVGFASMFTVKREGKDYDVTEDMLESNVKAEPGEYQVTFRKNRQFKTLTVIVTDAHEVEVGKAYNELRLTAAEAKTHDYTKDFWLYVDKLAAPVTAEMIDASALEGELTENEAYDVVFTYDNNGTPVTATMKVRIVPQGTVAVNARNEETYPNAAPIDLTTLFTITRDGVSVPVTSDMIIGSVDYSKVGTYTITLTYAEQQYTATVTVRQGAIVKYARGEKVTIRRGTDKSAYDFASDFIVVINGMRYRDIQEFIDTTAVDFNTVGDYTATLKVPYNEKPLAAGSVKFTYTELTITYAVRDREYSCAVKDNEVSIKKGSSENLFNFLVRNLNVVINGYEQQFTDNPEYAGGLTCYVEIVSGPGKVEKDFDKAGTYNIVIDVYVNGPDSDDPVRLSYILVVNSDVKITATGGSAFVGKGVYLPDLFTVTDGGEEVEVTIDMITGYVDFFTPGSYTVTLTYRDEGGAEFSKSTLVTVFDAKFAGTYKTRLTTIAEASSEDDEGYVVGGKDSEPIGDLVIDEDMNITIGGLAAMNVTGVDENTFTFDYTREGNTYTLHFEDGIVILVPHNSVKMKYNDRTRSLIYFNTEMWEIRDFFTVNSRSSYILNDEYVGFSIDCTRIASLDGSVNKWFALKTALTSKVTSDYYYDVTWGEATFNKGFAHKIVNVGQTGNITFGGARYVFGIKSIKHGQISSEYDDTSYYGKSFTGGIDGVAYTLTFNGNGHPTLKKGTETVFALNSIGMHAQKYGGFDSVSKTFAMYGSIIKSTNKSSGNVSYSYEPNFQYETGESDYETIEVIPVSYKFVLDVEACTFTYVSKDDVFGLYRNGNAYIFLDGYGEGVVCFDTKNYYVYSLEYELENNNIHVNYVGADGSFKYNRTAEFYIDAWKNIVTAKSVAANDGITGGTALENAYVESGAIVRVGDLRISVPTGADGKTIDTTAARAELMSRFTIITKDGELTGTDKTNAIKTKISYKLNGFYEATVSIKVDGVTVTNYYAVQIIVPKYELANPFVGKFTSAIPETGAAFEMNVHGMIKLTSGNTVYTGVADVTDNSFICFAYSAAGHKLTVKGSVYSDNVIFVTGTGAENVTAYFTKGSADYAGIMYEKNKYYVLRSVTTIAGTEFFLSTTPEGMGAEVSVRNYVGTEAASLSTGAILAVAENGSERIVRIDKLGEYKTGISFASGPVGTFTSGADTVAFNGFGEGTYNGVIGTYAVIDDRSVVFKYSAGSDAGLITRIDTTADGTFTDAGSPLALENIRGSYVAKLDYYGASELLTDTVTFMFNADGTVKITYKIDKADDEQLSSMPEYADAVATAANVTLRGDVLTVVATKNTKTYTFKFTVLDPVNPTSLRVDSAPANTVDDYTGPWLSSGEVLQK